MAVPPTSDLNLLKLAAGGHLDLHDAAALLVLGDREQVIAGVEARLGDVRPDVRMLWRAFAGLSPIITSADFVREAPCPPRGHALHVALIAPDRR